MQPQKKNNSPKGSNPNQTSQLPHPFHITITSRSNERVKTLLKQTDRYLFFEGRKLVEDILSKQIPIHILVIGQDLKRPLPHHSCPIAETWTVNEIVLKKLSSLKESPDLIAVLPNTPTSIDFSKSQVVIGVDSIQDPANAGTIFRCASAFGIDGIAFSGASVKASSQKFLRGAQDAFLTVPFEHFDSIEKLVEKAAAANFNIYLTSSHSPGQTIAVENLRFPALILFGNEGSGLPGPLLHVYPALKIAQTNQVESLNVGVSACIIMHEIRRLLT